ncbi:MAG: amidophosphoribosyltransferase [Chitinophagaceae bacterium]|nr:amidophosphoribosyltransferase [Chitinophagaceae bacterium]
MSDEIKHECGLAYIRLLKPLAHYRRQYGSTFYALNKLYLLMEKQHNRGQDGAGIATVKLNTEPGYKFMHRMRLNGSGAIGRLFQDIHSQVAELEASHPEIANHPGLLKGYLPFMGEVLLGHLRYGTQGKNDVNFCHPFIKSDINPTRNLMMAGNFNLVNTEEILRKVQPDITTPAGSDLGAMIETIHHFLCKEDSNNPAALDVEKILRESTSLFDGGYVCSGLIGNGDSFVMRDPNGIRPAFFYKNDEIVVVASERPAIMTTFNVPIEEVQELKPGHAIIVDAEGRFKHTEILAPRELKACSFERIYFSRGSDADIYKERMQLGRNLAGNVLKRLNNDLKNTIVSFIPNTAETAFYGLIKGLEDYLKEIKIAKIKAKRDMTDEEMAEIISRRVRIEKLAIKDVKMRTFITEDASRDEMVQHVYDITYGTVQRDVDTLVVIDDSIVRGTTLRQSIIKMLDRLGPKKIIIVSSAPQIRFPDCYGIDMSKMGEFIAFQAAIALLKDTGMQHIIDDTYKACKKAQEEGTLQEQNYVKAIYESFTAEEISHKIARMLKDDEVHADVEIVYQTLEGLYDACPNHTGDWYFTGNYPTPGGNRVSNKAFINYIEQKTGRGY